MGPGGSLEAPYALKADVPAGTYHVICDSIIIRAVDVQFELIWRRDTTDTTLAIWMESFEPLPNGSFKAQPYEIHQTAPAIDFQPGDLFIFKYSGSNTVSNQAFIPNGDGPNNGGRFPQIILPQ
ncbi:MAG: hypothetical protein H0T46_07615 [Deltaproteobacteria bacterium]|nr:hypothetical protein [Deltaproteobacteria bacterium]